MKKVIICRIIAKDYEENKDPQLEKAIEIIKNL